MKKLLFAAAASIALISSPAFAAPTDSQSFDISATVQSECSLETLDDVPLGALDINTDPGTGALLIDGTTSAPAQSKYASCNYPTTVTLTSANDGLENAAGIGSADPGEFTALINYSVSMDFAAPDADVTLNTNAVGNSASVSQVSAFHDQAEITVTVSTAGNTLRPVAGTYEDTVTVNLGAI